MEKKASARAFHVMSGMAIAMGMMLSPESLIVVGQGVGRGGVFFVFAISLATILYVPNVMSQSVVSMVGGETRLMRASIGPVAAGASLFCSRVFFTLCALPVLASTAGYVFNETFLYWFPNFLFAHLMLLFLAGLNIAHRRAAEVFQVFFISIVVCGLLVLSLIGISSPPRNVIIIAPAGFVGSLKPMATAILIFVGFDLMYIRGNATGEASPAMTALMVVALVAALWAMASFFHVPLAKLAGSTVPYSRAARAIYGEPGRLVMGVVLIAGSLAAVNALLMAVGRMMTTMASEGLLPRVFLIGSKRDIAPVVFLAGTGAAFMLLGFAGEPRLLQYMKGALLFWLLHYAVLHLSVILVLRDRRARSNGSIFMMSLFGALVYITAFVTLACVSGQRAELLRVMLYLMATGTAISGLSAIIERSPAK